MGFPCTLRSHVGFSILLIANYGAMGKYVYEDYVITARGKRLYFAALTVIGVCEMSLLAQRPRGDVDGRLIKV